MNEKECLVNELVMRLADMVDAPISELKSAIEIQLYDWQVRKIDCTAVVAHDGVTTSKLLMYFRIGKMGSNRNLSSIQQYELVARQLCNFCNKELNMITSEDIKFFMVMYKQQYNISDVTMDGKRRMLSSVFGYLYKNKQIAENPMDRIDPVAYKRTVKTPLSDAEFERIIIACEGDKRMIAILYFFINTGVRVTELCTLLLKDVDFVKGRALVLGKGNKERFVYFDGKTRERLINYLNTRKDITFEAAQVVYSNDTPLFASERGGYHAMKAANIQQMMRDLREPSRVDRLHPHLLRATFATNLYLKGVDIGIIAKALGHADLSTIDRYVLMSDNQVANALNKFSQ